MDLFFTTSSCQLCKPIKKKIEDGVYQGLDIVSDDIALMMQYNVRSVPAVFSKESGKLIVGQKAVIEYLEGKSGSSS